MLAVGGEALGRDVEVEADSGVEGVGAPHQHIPGYGAPAPVKLLSSIVTWLFLVDGANILGWGCVILKKNLLKETGTRLQND